ncbi:MAG: hypothetical protein NXI12_07070 [Alphaproteobacteria bacterium]|nr:hypothetical protein [Alphaproteobacteria bacterium]
MRSLFGAGVIALSLAPFAAAASPEQAVCQISFEAGGEDGAPERVQASCPGAEPALQAAADASLQRLDLAFDPRADVAGYEVAESLVLTASGQQAWSVAPGQILVKAMPLFPARAAQRGATHMVCAVALVPDERGRPSASPVECLADVRRAQGAMERAMTEAVSNWRLAPTDFEYCMDEQVYVQAAIIVRGGRPHRPNPMPDPERLPALCEAG